MKDARQKRPLDDRTIGAKWLRLYDDMVVDAKWQTIARQTRRPAHEVITCFISMLERASASAERGCLSGWCENDVAEICEIKPRHVKMIYRAMEGRVKTGASLSGWSRRQPADQNERRNGWIRLWHGLSGDPKWRSVSAQSPGSTRSECIAVFIMMLCRAGAAAKDLRGSIAGWSDEDASHLLGIGIGIVTSIRSAMQGRVLDGDRLISWEKRQPKRERYEPDKAERKREERRRMNVAPCRATSRHVRHRLDERIPENTPPPPQGGQGAADHSSEKEGDLWFEFEPVYPWDVTEPKFGARKVFDRLKRDEQLLAVAHAKRYGDDCRSRNRKICHAKTWLRDKGWEPYAEAAAKAATAGKPVDQVWVPQGTAAFEAWNEIFKRIHPTGIGIPVHTTESHRGLGCRRPTLWPPDLEPADVQPPISLHPVLIDGGRKDEHDKKIADIKKGSPFVGHEIGRRSAARATSGAK